MKEVKRENPRIKSIKTRETGIARAMMDQVKAAHRGDPMRQITAFFELFSIPAGIGRKRAASFETHRAYKDRLSVMVKTLRALNMPIQNLDEVTAKQVKKMFLEFERQGRAAGWLANMNTTIRRCGIWIGKPDLCPPVAQLVVNPESCRRQHSALYPKDWEARGVEVEETIEQISMICPVTGLQMRLAAEFGVRFQEFLMFKPFEATKTSGFIYVRDGTKGGRPRLVPIEFKSQHQAIELAKNVAAQDREGRLIAKAGMSLRQANAHARYILKKAGVTKSALGVTPHGLRHRYACRIYQQLTGELPPVLGGTLMDRARHNKAVLEIAERLGHSRPDIVSAYIGNHRTINQFQKRNLQWLSQTLEGDDALCRMSEEVGIEEITAVGDLAEGDRIKANQVVTFWYRAKKTMDEDQNQADCRVARMRKEIANRIGVLLGAVCVLGPASLLNLDENSHIPTFSLFLAVKAR